MNIVQVVRSLELGGLERVALDLAIAQKGAGHCVSIYSVYKHEPALLDEAERAGLRVVQFNKQTGFSSRTLWSMARHLRRDQVSILHTHNELVHTYGVIAGRLAGVPCIVNTIHGTKGGKDSRLNRYRALLPWTDAVVTVSDETAAQFAAERTRYRDRFYVIRNGIPVNRFAAFSAQPGSQWPRIRLGTVARLADVKDQATLIQAFHIVQKINPQVELHILGDGPLRPVLESLSKRLELNRSITFHGASPKVAEFLSKLDVFILSSISEGLPIAVLEAMSAGLPIVSTRVGGICEVATEHEVAEYCMPSDPEALAHAIKSVLEPERMKVMGQTGQAIAQRSFTIQAMSKSYDSLYRTLLSEKSSYFTSLFPRWNLARGRRRRQPIRPKH
ncbi:MAG TPA: glycosyltransferase [Candidatus Acidoferrales bacterium]|nr:glycosyltransferase [Candidatus Acidoferrales bacterium]